MSLPPAILRAWVHSHEEDTPEARIYRPRGYAFPPARGRDGFEFREDGGFIRYGIAPADGSAAASGRWRADEDVIVVELDASEERLEPIRVLSCDDERLVIAR